MAHGYVQYDEETDVLYVRLPHEGTVERTVSLDDLRLIDYSAEGAVIGIEFVDASGGVDLRDVPFAETAEKLIRESDLEFPVFA